MCIDNNNKIKIKKIKNKKNFFFWKAIKEKKKIGNLN